MAELLQFEDFKPHVGKTVRFKGTPFTFRLDQVLGGDQPIPPGGQRRPFMLIFRGKKEREYMREGMYECEIEGGPTHLIYVNPIQTPSPEWQDYQAVFN